MIIKIIIDLYMFFILSAGLNGYLLLGLSKLEMDVKFLGLEENSITSYPPIREILYDYQLNLMSLVKIHPRHTSEIQCPVLCPRILHRLTYFVSGTMLALPFFILPQWNISRHIACRQAPYFFIFGKRCG